MEKTKRNIKFENELIENIINDVRSCEPSTSAYVDNITYEQTGDWYYLRTSSELSDQLINYYWSIYNPMARKQTAQVQFEKKLYNKVKNW